MANVPVVEEIEDPEGYCFQKIEKIEAVHGSLKQSVQMGNLKPEKSEALKRKFEDLREALRKKLAAERKLAAEMNQLEFEKQQQAAKLEKYKQEAKRDQETIALIGEDAEQADAEAAMAMDRCDKALVETEHLKEMRIDYKNRIVQIEREFFIALEPVVARLKQEIKTEQEGIKDNFGKLDQAVQEIKDSEAGHVRILEEMQDLKIEKFEVQNKLDELAGKPERLRKQIDVLEAALKVTRTQVDKWTVKEAECEKELHDCKLAIKSKKEQHVQNDTIFQKMQLLEQEQETLAKDLNVNMERALADGEVYYNDQVYLDLQLIGKQLELKHVDELHSKALREREKALIRLAQVQEQLEALQASLPTYEQERNRAHKELMTVNEENAKWEEKVADAREDVERALRNLRATEALGDEVLTEVRECNRKVQELEKDLVKMTQEERQIEALSNDLKKQAERLTRAASQKYTMWKETMEKIDLEKRYNIEFQKRVDQLTKEHEDNILLYNNLRAQRNRFQKLVERSEIALAKWKEKIVPLAQQAENLRSDVAYKMKVLDKLHQRVLETLRASQDVRKDINKAHQIMAQKKVIIEEIKTEKHKLEEFIEKKGYENKKMIATYTFQTTRRNAVGLNLIDRNDELSILYEKLNVQVDLLKFSEQERNKRIDEVNLLRRDCDRVHSDILTAKRAAPDPTSLFNEYKSLQVQVKTSRVTLDQLSDLCENPFKETKRWRQLKGFDLKSTDLERKAWAIQVFLNEQENKANEKDIILEELAVLLNSEMRKGALKFTKSADLSRKLNEYMRNQMTVNRSLAAAISECALVQARAMSMKRDKEGALDQLNEAQLRLEAGECPTEEAEREWEHMKRDPGFARKAAKMAEGQNVGTRPKTTPNMISYLRAEKRPMNAYHGDSPYALPVHLPARPSTPSIPGSNSVMIRRSARKPSTPATRMSLVATKS